MDKYAHLEAFDSLDYLIPPVKKNYSNLKRDTLLLWERKSHKKNPGFPVSRQYRKRVILRNIQDTNPRSSASNTSLYLKQPTERLLREQHTILDVIERKLLQGKKPTNFTESKTCYRNQNTEKPIIKITVIPKSVKTQTSKVFNKLIFKKGIVNSVSNQEHSTQSKNIYLVVSGRKREKVYELKTSESENLSKKWRSRIKCNIPIQESSKQFLDSLEMNRNQKGNKKKDGKLYYGNNQVDPKQLPLGTMNYHNIQREIKSSKLNITSPKSRVTIVGRLGVTEDDRYVLNCAATVNDKPIPTNVTQIKNGTSFTNVKPATNMNQFSTYGRPKKHAVWNASLDNSPNLNMYRDMNTENEQIHPRMESHGIQVNLCVPNNKTRTKSTKDKYIQCMCQYTDTDKSDDENENFLRKCQSPIVVISVYPKSENAEANLGHTVKVEQRHIPSQRYIAYREDQRDTTKKTNEKNFTSREMFRSKSPTQPRFSPEKIDYRNLNDSHNFNNNLKSTSPSRPPILSPTPTRKLNNNNQYTYSKREDTHKKSIVPNVSRSRPPKKSYSNESRSEMDTLNASRNLAKKALVDRYINKLNSDNLIKNTRKKHLVAKDDASKVTINIDGETEQYDLLFERSGHNTNLAVRKTMKDSICKKKTGVADNETASLENLLLVNLSQDMLLPRRNSLSQSKTPSPVNVRNDLGLTDNKPNTPKLNKKSSKLCVRDSIEISHRRSSLSSGANPKSVPAKNNHKNPRSSSESTNSKAQVKHYRGDDCPIPDPTERDIEIRELLGILTGRKCKPKTNSKQRIEDIFPVYKYCQEACCREECNSEKKLMTGISLSKLPANNCVQNFIKKLKNIKTEKQNETDKKKAPSSLPTLEDKKQNYITPVKDEHQDSKFECKCTLNIRQHQNEILNTGNCNPHNKFEKCNESKCQNEPKQPLLKCPHCNEPKNPPNKEITNGASLILNRNIQVFLQVEQFKKQRPIILTRKQYEKVKKTIQSTISKKTSNERRRCCNYNNNYSIVSIGDVKIRSKFQRQLCISKEVQTGSFENTYRSEFLSTHESFDQHELSLLSPPSVLSFDKNVGNGYKLSDASLDVGDGNIHNTVNQKPGPNPRKAISSLEVRYASVAFIKHVTYSSPTCSRGLESSMYSSTAQNDSNSLHTIFKGYKKSVTPNLGTSAFSLCSDTDSRLSDKSKRSQFVQDPKSKKPLLQRLVSCLIMRSTRVSAMKIGKTPARKQRTINSSIDSYHISTSFAGIEIPSSMYDTSASFYSNHAVLPVNRIKRGFFSSVRGFLTSRRN